MKRVVYIIITFFLIWQTSYCQKEKDTTLYFDEFGKYVCCKDSSISYSIVTYDTIHKKYFYRKFISRSISHGDFIEAGELSSINPEIKDGDSYFYDVFGNEIHMNYYKNNFIKLSECFDENHKPIEELYTFDIVDSIPKFNDFCVDSREGFHALSDFIKSNLDSLLTNKETTNYLIFIARVIIEENGKISKITIHKIKGSKLQNETIIKKQIENLLIETVFKPAIFKQNNVRASGELIIKI